MTQTVPGFDRLTIEPGKLGGSVCIRGLRFTVEQLLEMVVDGWSYERIHEDFPFIEPEDVRQAVAYAASLVTREFDVPTAHPV